MWLSHVHNFIQPPLLNNVQYSTNTVTRNALTATAGPHVLPTSVTSGTVNDVPNDQIVLDDTEMTCEDDDTPPSPLSESDSEEDNV